MKNLKKIALLLSILTVFAISCQDAQQTVSSTFDVITDDPTSVPDNPPTVVEDTTLDPLPEDFTITPTEYSATDISQGNWGTTFTVDIQKGSRVKSYSLKTQASFENRTDGIANPNSLKTQASFENRTDGIANPTGVLSSIELRNPNFQAYPDRRQLDVNASIFAALGSKGQSAKIKLDVYVDAKEDSKNFRTGIRTLYINVKRSR